MAKRTFNTPVKVAICFALIAVLAVGAFADYQNAREYNIDQITLASGVQYMYEIKYQGRTFGNYRFSDTLHANGVYRYDSASFTGGQLSVPYPPYSPVYMDYLYQSNSVPSPNNGFEHFDIMTLTASGIDLTIPEGYVYIDLEVVSFKGTFTGFNLVYEQDGTSHTVTLDYTSPNVHAKQTTYLPNFSQASSYAVTSSVARYVVDTTGLVPVNATLKSVSINITFPRIPITDEVYSGTPANRRHVNYICYITPVYITVNETDVSRILYETRLANDKLEFLASTNRDLYEAIQRNQRYEQMIDEFLATMGNVNINSDIHPDINTTKTFFTPIFAIDPIPSMLGISVTFLFISAFLRKA